MGDLSFGKEIIISFNNLECKSPKESSSKPSNAVATLFSAGSKMASSWGEHYKKSLNLLIKDRHCRERDLAVLNPTQSLGKVR